MLAAGEVSDKIKLDRRNFLEQMIMMIPYYAKNLALRAAIDQSNLE